MRGPLGISYIYKYMSNKPYRRPSGVIYICPTIDNKNGYYFIDYVTRNVDERLEVESKMFNTLGEAQAFKEHLTIIK